MKNFIQFIQILVLICIILSLLYWIQNLIGSEWAWFASVKPFITPLVKAGEHIYNGSITLFEANFEFKYFIAVILLLLIYYALIFANKVINFCQETYCDGRRFVKKVQENAFNNRLERNVKNAQRKIDKYQIYLTTQPKKNSIEYSSINLSEENKQMNKFLIEKTGIIPSVVKNGFVYSFNNFEQIDKVLENFFVLLNSKAPLDYYICVYLVSDNTNITQKNFEELSDINIKNKIITLSDLSLRYNYNKEHAYETSVLGMFQKGNEAYEVHQFTEKTNVY